MCNVSEDLGISECTEVNTGSNFIKKTKQQQHRAIIISNNFSVPARHILKLDQDPFSTLWAPFSVCVIHKTFLSKNQQQLSNLFKLLVLALKKIINKFSLRFELQPLVKTLVEIFFPTLCSRHKCLILRWLVLQCS